MYIFNFDALALEGEEFMRRNPRRNGVNLWKGLYDSQLGRLGVVVTEEVNADHLEAWFHLHNVRASIYEIIDPCLDPPHLQIESMMIRNGMKTGDMYVDVSPSLVAKVLGLGIPSLLLCDPLVLRSEWDDISPRSKGWEDLVGEIDRQKIYKAKKEWREVA